MVFCEFGLALIVELTDLECIPDLLETFNNLIHFQLSDVSFSILH